MLRATIIPRAALAEAQNWRCAYCSVVMEAAASGLLAATREHIIPRSQGGRDGWSNLVAACRGCNEARSDLTDAFAFERLRRKHLSSGKWPHGVRPPPNSRAKIRESAIHLSVLAWQDRHRATRARFIDMAMGRYKRIPHRAEELAL